MNNHDVSVVIPAYNAEKWITRALDSVRAQTQPVAEMIVVDDGSTDNTAEAVGRYGSSVKYLRQPNAGPSEARNRGIDEARGPWIAFLDADDEWYPHKIRGQMELLTRNPDLRWCACNLEIVIGDDVRPGPLPRATRRELRQGPAIHYLNNVSNGLILQTSGLIVHREVFDRAGKFDPQLKRGEDLKLWCQIAFLYPRIGFCPEVCFRYHGDVPGSLTRTVENRDLQLRTLLRLFDDARSAAPQAREAFYPYARKRIRDYLYRSAGRQITISDDVLRQARNLLAPGPGERALLTLLPLLPKPMAQKILNRFTS